jgi:arginine deiminase
MKPDSEMHLETALTPASCGSFTSFAELIARADAAIYRSKRAGKNCFCLHGESQTMCIPPARMDEHKV